MSLTVETGAGLANAESYISVADADSYHSVRGNTTWGDLDTEPKEQALRRATDYMVQTYRQRWKGTRATEAQALDWPRYGASLENDDRYLLADSVVPNEVAQACAKLALRAVTADLAPDVDRVTKREKIGPMEFEYSDSAPPYVRYREIDNMLSPFLMNVGACKLLVRG